MDAYLLLAKLPADAATKLPMPSIFPSWGVKCTQLHSSVVDLFVIVCIANDIHDLKHLVCVMFVYSIPCHIKACGCVGVNGVMPQLQRWH